MRIASGHAGKQSSYHPWGCKIGKNLCNFLPFKGIRKSTIVVPRRTTQSLNDSIYLHTFPGKVIGCPAMLSPFSSNI